MLVPYRSSDGPVGAPLERSDVTERAAVDAAHVRVERPPERHALHSIQRGAAGLFAILDSHPRGQAYRTYVRIASRGRAGDPPGDPAAAERAAARPLLPAPRRGRLDARRHRARAAGAVVGGDPRPGRRAGRADLHHAHAPRSRRRRGGGGRGDGRARLPGPARLRPVRARLGLADWPERIADWFVAPRRAAGGGGGADRVRARVRRLRPLRVEPDARRARRRGRRLARARNARATPTATSPSTATACSSRATRCSRRSRPRSASIPRAGPIRSATTSTRCALAELDPRVSYGGHGETDPRAGRARARDRRAPRRAARPHRSRARRGAAQRLRRLARSLRRTLPPIQRRFAVAETLSHLERLVVLGRARRDGDARTVTYTAA